MTSQNHRAPVLCYVKLCALFQSHQWIETGVTVRKTLNWDQNRRFFSPLVTLKFEQMTLRIYRAPHLCYFKLLHHFIAICEFKLELQSSNAPIRVKISNFFVLCDLEIRRMTFKNNRAPFLCYFKLDTSFHSHWSIQTGVTVRKRTLWVKIGDFRSHVTLKFEGWPWKTIGHLFYGTSRFVYHFITIGQFKLELQSGNAQFWSKSMIFCLVWPWNLTDDLGKS